MQGRDSNAAPALHPSPLCPLHLNRPKSVKDVPGLKCQPCARLHIRGNDEPWRGGTKPVAVPNRSWLIMRVPQYHQVNGVAGAGSISAETRGKDANLMPPNKVSNLFQHKELSFEFLQSPVRSRFAGADAVDLSRIAVERTPRIS